MKVSCCMKLTVVLLSLSCELIQAGSLTGTFTSLATTPPGGSTNVNLTSIGTVDWVHWGFYSDSSVDRKGGVMPQISDYTVIGSSNDYLAAYQYTDNQNGYTWYDGTPTTAVTNTHSG